jgi:hypothetical protein
MGATMIRAKLTRLGNGAVMSAPSPRVRILWHHNQGQEHVIAYLGFVDAEVAEACYRWLVDRFGKYNRDTNAGVNKPRRASRVDGCLLEIKWHSPQVDTLHRFIEKDLTRVKVNA